MLISQYGVNQLKQNKHIIKELYFYFHNYIFFNAKERGQFHVLCIMTYIVYVFLWCGITHRFIMIYFIYVILLYNSTRISIKLHFL